MVGVYYIASVSFGKDSLAMLLQLMERGWPLDEVIYFNTGMEFEAIYHLRDRIKPLLSEHGILFTELAPPHPFLWYMFDKPVGGKYGPRCGYGWCGGPVRWGTSLKTAAISHHKRGLGPVTDYVGIAADEGPRIARNVGKCLPLVEWGMTEADCLAYCRARGYSWQEDGADLYDILDRVSCWCCRNKNIRELRNIYYRLPGYWQRLMDLQSRLPPMKRQGLGDLERRFQAEGEQMRMES